MLLGDTNNEVVYLMDVQTGTYTTPLTNMSGVNGVETVPGQGYVYWANHNAQTVSRVEVDGDAVPIGSREVLVQNEVDDFALEVGPDGTVKRAYLAAMMANEVVEVVLATGAKRVVAADLSGIGLGFTSTVVFGRGETDKRVLYATVGVGGQPGQNFSAGIVAIDL